MLFTAGCEAINPCLVTTGLDPVVHAEVRRFMDCRIKSGKTNVLVK
jgi:hypothetical protein